MSARFHTFRLGLVVLLLGAAWVARAQHPYQDPALPTATRVQDLLARMTPDEKFRQLFMVAGELGPDSNRFHGGLFGFQVEAGGQQADATGQLLRYTAHSDAGATLEKINGMQRYFMERSRLNIPMLAFDEALHGLVRRGATAFPQAIALAATFDTAAMARTATAIALETKARGLRMVLSPVVNVATDVRWGRVEETYGEDPLLVARMGTAYVQAMEGRGIITTPKHFVANHGDGGRDSYPAHWNERHLREVYLKPFQACIQQGGARSIMTAYNALDGRPCSANNWLLNDVLRGDWGFRGFVISDAAATGGANVLHYTASDYADAGRQSVEHGQDVIFQTDFAHYDLFKQPYLDGTVPTAVLDRAVARVLTMKFELGLFDQPYVDDQLLHTLDMEAHRTQAYEMAVKGAVLLRNQRHTLPITPTTARIAVVGHEAMEARLGGYSGPGNAPVSIWDGLRERLGDKGQLQFTSGVERDPAMHHVVPASVLSHRYGRLTAPGLHASYYDGIDLNAAPTFTRIDPQVDFQWTLFGPDPRVAFDHFAVRWEGAITPDSSGTWKIGISGNDGYRLYLEGQLVIDRWDAQGFQTTLVPQRFTKGRSMALRIEYRERAGNAWFKLVWDKDVRLAQEERNIARAVELARKSDHVIAVVGIEEGEFRDRSNLKLPGRQEELIQRLCATGKPVTVVLVGGSAITMDAWIEGTGAVLHAWYPGEAGGQAIADLLLGHRNPGGRLPITFPRSEGQLPLVYNHHPTGRGDDYVDGSGQPLFPFGYGLSYTTFHYDSLHVDKPRFHRNDTVVLRCHVTNTGAVAGDEVVQLYFRDELASMTRPVKELLDFQRITLEPGETRAVSFRITTAQLAFLDAELDTITEPGTFRLMVGASSKDIRLRTVVELVDQ